MGCEFEVVTCFFLFRGTPEAPPRKMNVCLFLSGERLSASIVPSFLVCQCVCYVRYFQVTVFLLGIAWSLQHCSRKTITFDYFSLLLIT